MKIWQGIATAENGTETPDTINLTAGTLKPGKRYKITVEEIEDNPDPDDDHWLLRWHNVCISNRRNRMKFAAILSLILGLVLSFVIGVWYPFAAGCCLAGWCLLNND